jgi:hypothetical protein
MLSVFFGGLGRKLNGYVDGFGKESSGCDIDNFLSLNINACNNKVIGFEGQTFSKSTIFLILSEHGFFYFN